MQQNKYIIKKALIKNADIIAKIHTQTWQIVYRGLIPNETLDNISVEKCKNEWQERLKKNFCEVLLIEVDNTVSGFVSFCPSRDEDSDLNKTAEISAIYLLPEYFNRGLGKQLLSAALEIMQVNGYQDVILWVFTENQQACQFYEKMGFYVEKILTDNRTYTNIQLSKARYRKKLFD